MHIFIFFFVKQMMESRVPVLFFPTPSHHGFLILRSLLQRIPIQVYGTLPSRWVCFQPLALSHAAVAISHVHKSLRHASSSPGSIPRGGVAGSKIVCLWSIDRNFQIAAAGRGCPRGRCQDHGVAQGGPWYRQAPGWVCRVPSARA